ncbi:MAG: maltotransferase domain-containing protein, partial [Acidimicrobiales bacterium]
MLGRITIDSIRPATPSRQFPTKAIVGERVTVSADIFRDGHDLLAARVRWRRVGQDGKGRWNTARMADRGNDRWEAVISAAQIGCHEIVIEAWRDRFATWRHDIEIKAAAGDDVEIELEEGARILEALAAGVAARHQGRVLDAAGGLRRASCSVHVRLNAGLDDQVARLVAGVPDADLTQAAPVPLWVDRPRALFGAW